MTDCVLIACPGRTDPIRDTYDGPVLHIVRHYHPVHVVLILSEGIKQLGLFDSIKKAVETVAPECRVSGGSKTITNPFSFDALAGVMPLLCNDVKKKFPGRKILINISSGTAQMQAALCMIAMLDPETYVPIQVNAPSQRSAQETPFDPEKDDLESWMETNQDNLPGSPSRCSEPKLLNFQRPMLQMQLASLVRNYDYSGAYQLYEDNRTGFPARTGWLLLHAERRLNLEYIEARKAVNNLKLKKEELDRIYPVKLSQIARLTDYYNSMKVKQQRKELNDFILRLEVLTAYSACYLLEKCLGIPREEIADRSGDRRYEKYILSADKCRQRLPGLMEYLDQQFSETRLGRFQWSEPLTALSTAYICVFCCSTMAPYRKYEDCAREMLQWALLSGPVRNPAAHTTMAITEQEIQNAYDGKGSRALCTAIESVFCRMFASETKADMIKAAFAVYEQLNDMILEMPSTR